MTNSYDAEVTALFALAEACRAWAKEASTLREHAHAIALRHLADKLDDIAKRICERWTESLP